jgi:transcription termination factor Rho
MNRFKKETKEEDKDMNEEQDYKAVRQAQYQSDSKDRLSKIIRKKIQTTMIGALSSIEENFGFLWDGNNEDITPETRQQMSELYQKIRSEVLDKGNTQARNVDAELANYDVSWLRHSISIPVVKRPPEFKRAPLKDQNEKLGK